MWLKWLWGPIVVPSSSELTSEPCHKVQACLHVKYARILFKLYAFFRPRVGARQLESYLKHLTVGPVTLYLV